jgi:hypothetical protein
MKKLKSIKEQLIATTQSAKEESENRLNNLDLNERINRAETIILGEKTKKIVSEKTVRDAFTLQQIDIKMIKDIKQKCLQLGIEVNKSLIVRAGILVLSDMSTEDLHNLIKRLPKVKVGRPKV